MGKSSSCLHVAGDGQRFRRQKLLGAIVLEVLVFRADTVSVNWNLNNRVHTAGCLRRLSVVLLWQDNKLFALSVCVCVCGGRDVTGFPWYPGILCLSYIHVQCWEVTSQDIPGILGYRNFTAYNVGEATSQDFPGILGCHFDAQCSYVH